MSGIVSSPKAPKPDPSIAAAQLLQEKNLAKQEARLDERERSEQSMIQSRRRARRQGGLRLLLSPDREDPMTGLQDTLGNST